MSSFVGPRACVLILRIRLRDFRRIFGVMIVRMRYFCIRRIMLFREGIGGEVLGLYWDDTYTV